MLTSSQKLVSEQVLPQFEEVLTQQLSAQTLRIFEHIANLNKDVPKLAVPELEPKANYTDTQAVHQNLQIESEEILRAPVDSEELVVQDAVTPAGNVSEGGNRCSAWTMTQKDDMKLSFDPHTLLKESGVFRKIHDSMSFRVVSFFMIIANAIYIGVEADWNPGTDWEGSGFAFSICEQIFCAFFTFELVVHYGSFRNTRDTLKDKWFILDFVLVLMIITETWVFPAAMAFISNPPNTGVVGGIGRMLRLLRLTRMSRLMQMIPELVTMVKGMIAAIRAVHAALLILSLLVYVFAIIMNSLVGAEEGKAGELFSTVRGSMVTLLVQGVLLDDISGLTRTLIEVANVAALGTLSIFVLLSALTVMNMLIGVLCQVVLDVSADEKETRIKAQMQRTLLVMLHDLDDDNSGHLTKSEVQSLMLNPDAIAQLNDIQVDPQHLLDLTEMLYVDEDSTLSIAVIMNIVLSLRGRRPPTMHDICKANSFLLWALENEMEKHRAHVAEKLKSHAEESAKVLKTHLTMLPSEFCFRTVDHVPSLK
jgi:voltage-gated sodium channel